jgi:hypothetical protein
MQYQFDKWMYSTWHKNTRFYRLDLCQDLFGNWLVSRIWGSNLSRGPGQSIEVACNSYEEAAKLFYRQEKKRFQRGYCCSRS